MARTVVLKNTFIDFATDSSSAPQIAKRSRSAEVPRSRSDGDRRDLTLQYLQGLDAVLSIGNALPEPGPKQESFELGAEECMPEGAQISADCEETTDVDSNLSELYSLQERLAKALAGAPAKPLSDKFRNFSTSSFSTAASEEGNTENIEKGGSTLKGMEIESLESESLDQSVQSLPRVASPTEQMKHASVPRTRDFAEVYNNSAKDEPPTTMMIRNIPGRYTQTDFLQELQAFGFDGTFDFMYLPIDKASSTNVGYAFVNFIDPSWAVKCQEVFEGYRFKRFQRASNGKVAKVSVAHLQGLEKNLQHYKKAVVNMAKEKRRRPMVIASLAATLPLGA